MKMLMKSKKFLALCLTLAMVIGFVPMGLFAFGQDLAWAGAASSVEYAIPKLTADTKFTAFNAFGANPGNVIKTGSTENWYASDVSDANAIIDTWNRVKIPSRNVNSYVGMVIKLPTTTGKYTLKVKIEPSYGTNHVDVFTMPSSTAAADGMISGNMLGSAAPASGYIDIGTVEVTDQNAGGDLKVVVSPSDDSTGGVGGASGSALHTMMLYGILLDGTAPPELASVKGFASPNEITTGESAILSVSGTLTDGSPADLSAANVVYTNLTPDYITLSDNVATFKAEGDAKVKATVTLNGVTKTCEIPIYCSLAAGELTWAGEEASTVYDFRYDCEANGYKNGVKWATMTSYNANTNPNFKFSDAGKIHSSKTRCYDNWMFIYADSTDYAYAATIKMPEKAGKYTVEFSYRDFYTAPSATLYLCDADATKLYLPENRVNATKIGKVTLRDNPKATGEIYTDIVGTVEVSRKDAGKEKILLILSEDANPNASEVSGAALGNYGLMFRSVTFSGENPNALGSVTLTSNKSNIEEGETAQLSVSGKFADGKVADLSNATIVYTSKNPEYANVDKNGVVTAVGNGRAYIEVSVTLDGVTKKAEVSINCRKALPWAGEENSIKYDFVKGTVDNENFFEFTDYNPDKNTTWKYHSSHGISALKSFYALAMRASSTETKLPVYVAFTAKAPKSGRYMASLKYQNHAGSKSFDVFMLPKDTEDIEAAMKSTMPLGFVEYNKAGAKNQKLGLIDIPEFNDDEVLLVFATHEINSVSSGTGRAGMSITDFTLSGKEPKYIDTVNLTLSTDTVATTMPAKAEVSATLENGDDADLSEDNLAVISLSSSDTSVATVDADGTITALKDGVATITATVTLDGVTKTASKEIVCTSFRGDAVTNTIDLMTGLAENGENVELLTEYNADKNARWRYLGNYINRAGRAVTKNGAISFIGVDKDNWSAIKFISGEASTYTIRLAYKNHAGATGVQAYVLPASVPLSEINYEISNREPIGDAKYTEGAEEQNVVLGPIALRKNTEYILVLQATGTGDDAIAGNGTLTATKLIFDGNAPPYVAPPITNVSLSVIKKLAIDGSTTATVAATLKDGSALDLNNAIVSYTSSDPNIIEVNAATGVLLGKAAGAAEITVTVSANNSSMSDTKTVEVAETVANLERPGVQYNHTYNFRKSYGKVQNTDSVLEPDEDFSGSGTLATQTGEYHEHANPDWKVHPTSAYTNAFYTKIKYVAKNASDYTAFIVKLPETPGSYGAVLKYDGKLCPPEISMYELPVDTADIKSALNEDTLVGSFVPNPEAGTYEATFGEIEIQPYEAGMERLFVFKGTQPQTDDAILNSSGVGAYGFYFYTLTLTGSRPLDGMIIELDNDSVSNPLGIGKSGKIKVTTPHDPQDALNANITFVSEDPEVATVTQDGIVTAHKAGLIKIRADAELNGYTATARFTGVAGTLKSRTSIITQEALEQGRENIEKYSWAASQRNSAVKEADKYVTMYDEIWNHITSQELPRGEWIKKDPYYSYCRYCGKDLAALGLSFTADPYNIKWKIQCGACRRYFPSNDFGKYYELGIDENNGGKYNPQLAKERNDEIIANGGEGYLVNVLYPEKDEYVDKNGVMHNEGVHGWGVDDGNGYNTGRYYTGAYSDIPEIHVYIPRYNRSIWATSWGYGGGLIVRALSPLRDAYRYTGEEKYGVAGAIIIDRVADVYHEMNLKWPHFLNSDGGSGEGQVLGHNADYNLAVLIADYYDAFWPEMENPKVINYLSEKAAKYNMENPKTSADLIRYNCDNGILRAIRDAIHYRRIWSNVGLQQLVMTKAAQALDTMPESGEWIDWLFETSEEGIIGEKGNFYKIMVNTVDRDGWGNEGAPGYNVGWMNSFSTNADALLSYADTYASANLYMYPKYYHAIKGISKLTLASRYTPLIGDTGQFAQPYMIAMPGLLHGAWKAGVKDDNIARLLYFLYDGDISDLNDGIYAKNPYQTRDEVMAIIEEKGAMISHPSENLTGTGFAVTRSGKWVRGNNAIDTQQNFWMYYGINSGHGNQDTLNLGVVAYGLDLSPDNGNPDYKSVDLNRITWSSTPMAHNTVFVVEENGKKNNFNSKYSDHVMNGIKSGDPYHFDDSGKVKLMDVDVPEVYDSAEIFRRTVVQVEATSEVSYAVDFFRVKGGNDHIYNFHAQGDEIEVDIPMVAQSTTTVDWNGNPAESSYAGPNVPYGQDELWNNDWSTPLKNPAGFTWIKNVYRAANPTASTISADFKIKDYFNVLPGDPNLHLKLTMLNTDSELTEFAYGDQRVPKGPLGTIFIKQIMARRQGKDLDSLFTTVIQPYKDNPYIEKVEEVPVVSTLGYEGKADAARAVKVTLKGGRIDYIVYTTNNTIKYRVDDKFDFNGFVGVVTYEEGIDVPVYTYMNDGTHIAGMDGTAAYTGTITDFTKEMSMKNIITVKFDSDVDLSKLVNQYIYIDNGGDAHAEYNGAYRIEGAVQKGSEVELDVGSVTTIHQYVDANDESKGYVYYMDEGQKFRIPLPTFDDASPIPNELPKQRVEAGNTLTFKVTAQSQTGNDLTYKMNDSVEGMIFDEQTQTFTWSPTTADRGDNIASFIVSDGLLETQFYVEIEVANPTGGSVAGGDTFPSGGGGGGGGGSDDPKPDDPTDDPNTDEPGTDEPGTTPGGDSGKKFVDLGNHAWAEDAIYELVDAGVINGTSANTYSPAKNITRADFATLAVRLFKFEGDAETFTDVPADKYYAESVGIAKANGIVNGISETEFAPLKEISREDMMVMLYRALKAAGIELPETVELTHSDFDEVSDYAKEAVSALIKSGLIAGSNGKINPKATATRAEVAVVLSRIYALISK